MRVVWSCRCIVVRRMDQDNGWLIWMEIRMGKVYLVENKT